MTTTQNPAGKIILTIAIPTYNGAGTLEDTLNSVISQLEPGVDIFVSDNASTDETAEIVRNYQHDFPQIHYQKNSENVGPDRNFDLAIRHSQGKFVWLFSDDDLLEPGAVGRVLDALKLYPDLGTIFVNYSVYTADNKCIDHKASKIEEDNYYGDGESFLSAINIGPIFCSSNVVRRSLWESSDSNRFIGSNWVHYGTITSVLRNTPAYCISAPYVRLISRATWNIKGQLYKNTLSLAHIINQLPMYGYSKAATKLILAVIAKRLPMTAIAAKRDGIATTPKLIQDTLLEFFRHFPAYSLGAVLLLLVPNVLYALAYRLYKMMRRK